MSVSRGNAGEHLAMAELLIRGFEAPLHWLASIGLFALIVFGTASCQRAASEPEPAPQTEMAPETRTLISGIAEVHDGDTFKFDGMRIRIWGIDAPENDQMCGTTNAGSGASEALLTIIPEGTRVECTMVDYDGYNDRPNAVCSTPSVVDIGARMVELGWAWDYAEYSDERYRTLQDQAQHASLGVHALGCELPWVLRARERDEAMLRREGTQAQKAFTRRQTDMKQDWPKKV
jgi:endonuclease YncB( thermonuclease family)